MEVTTPKEVTRVLGGEHTHRSINAETGDFHAILATEGEASDGHILSIRGMEVPASMPLMFQHYPDGIDGSLRVLGTLDGFRKRSGDLHSVGHVLVDDGAGEGLAFRQDVLAMMKAGGLPAMSIRWDTIKSTRRINLPKDHPAFVDASKTGPDDPRYYGYYIEKSRALEGSVVALPADSAALIARSREAASEESGAFLAALARDLESEIEPDTTHLDALRSVMEAIDAAREVGVMDEAIASLIAAEIDVSDLHTMVYTDGGASRSVYLPRKAWEQIQGDGLRIYRAAAAVLVEAKRASVKAEKKKETTRKQDDNTEVCLPSAEEIKIRRMRRSRKRDAQALREMRQAVNDTIFDLLGRTPRCR